MMSYVMLLNETYFLNMSYLTDSSISFTLKLESLQTFCSNRSIRSSSYGKKLFLKFLHAEAIFFYFILLSSFEANHKFSNKIDHLPAWRKIENIFFTRFRPGYFYLFRENRDWNSRDNMKIFGKVRKFWAVRSKQ